jgi:hypothetical protein
MGLFSRNDRIIDPYNTMGAAPARRGSGHGRAPGPRMGADTSRRRRWHHWDELEDWKGTGALKAMIAARDRLRKSAERGDLSPAQYGQAKERLRDRYDYDGPWEC